MTERILMAGAGGQGILFIGKMIARLACAAGEHVTYMPAYGAEVRGGTSYCKIVIASNEVANPVPDKLDTLVAMNAQALESFLPALEPDGLALVNSSLCGPVSRPGALAIPATEAADKLGNAGSANMVMLGAYVGRKRLFGAETVEREIAASGVKLGEKIAEINLSAFRAGMRMSG